MAGKLDEPGIDDQMEDGEIVDSDEDTEEKPSVPDLVSSTSKVTKSVPDLVPDRAPTTFREPPRLIMPPSNYRQAPAPCFSDNSDCDSDSEEEGNSSPQKAKRMSFGGGISSNSTFRNPLAEAREPGLQTDANLWGMDMSEPPKKRVNNIWGSILQEQNIEKEISTFGVEKLPEDMNDRSVESYNYLNARSDPRLLDPSSSESDSSPDEPSHDICDKESFALGPSKTRANVKSRLDKKLPKWDRSLNAIIKDQAMADSRSGGDSDGEECARMERKRTIKDRLGLDKKHVKFRVGERTERQQFIDVVPEDSREKVVNAIVDNLMEPNVDLVTRIVETVGHAKAIELMLATESVENQGGMMTVNGSRRRTPGGVFIQLLKSDEDITKEQVNNIFKEEKKQWNQRSKELRKVRLKRKMQLKEIAIKSQMRTEQEQHKERENSASNMDTAEERIAPTEPSPVKQDMNSSGSREGRTLTDYSEAENTFDDVDFNADVGIELE